MIRLIVAALCALLVSLVGGERAAFAAPPTPKPASSKVGEAVRLAEEGKTAFKAKKFMDAAEKFFAAYEMSGKATLLYNAARAYQEAGEFRLAKKLFEVYMKRAEAEDDPKGVVEAERRIIECEAEIQRAEAALQEKKEADAKKDAAPKPPVSHHPAGPASVDAPQDGVRVPDLPVVVVLPDGTHREVVPPEPEYKVISRFEPARLNSWKTWSGASALAVGVSLLVTGQQFGVSANERVIRSESDIAAYQSDFKTGRTLYYTGAGVIAAGVGMLIWASVDSFVEEEEEVVVAPTAAPGLVGATLTARF